MDAHLPRNRRVPDYFRDTVGFTRYQISYAKLQAGSSAVWMGMYAPVTQMRAAVESGHDSLLLDAGGDAEPIPHLELDGTEYKWSS